MPNAEEEEEEEEEEVAGVAFCFGILAGTRFMVDHFNFVSANGIASSFCVLLFDVVVVDAEGRRLSNCLPPFDTCSW